MYRIAPSSIGRSGQPGAFAKSALGIRTVVSYIGRPPSWSDKKVYPPKYKPPQKIAVLGGGLTGLTTAWYLSRWIPNAKITLFEASNRLGGWIDTETVPVTTPDGKKGTVSFERGGRMVHMPRQGTPKFDDMVFYEMIDALGLDDEVLRISRKAPLSNFIYYPDHLVEMPSPNMKLLKLIWKFATEPVFRGLLPALWNGWRRASSSKTLEKNHRKYLLERKQRRQADSNISFPQRDQLSLSTYYTLATGRRDVADNILSAMVHGIWGGDVSKLSDARDPFGHIHDRPALRSTEPWVMLTDEEADLPAVMTEGTSHAYDISWTMDATKNGHMCLKNGFSTLTNALVKALEANPNVTIKTSTPVTSLRMHASGSPLLMHAGPQDRPLLYEKVISTINADTLASITGDRLKSLADTHAVTIRAVNLWYPTPNLNAPYHGFGYLIPKTIKHELNPECALGVLFDSDREAITGHSPDTVPGTKFTVLLGGHYWDDLPPEHLPNSAQAIQMAKAVVARHLGIPQHENDRAVASTKLCRECIPQHYVGHWSRMEKARDELQAAFHGTLAVAGPSYQMPGVLGSIRAARDLAYYTAGFYPDQRYVGCSPVGHTGLDRFVALQTHWMLYRKADLPMRFPSYHLSQTDLPKPSLSQILTGQILPWLRKFFPPAPLTLSNSEDLRDFLSWVRLQKSSLRESKRRCEEWDLPHWERTDKLIELLDSVEAPILHDLKILECPGELSPEGRNAKMEDWSAAANKLVGELLKEQRKRILHRDYTVHQLVTLLNSEKKTKDGK